MSSHRPLHGNNAKVPADRLDLILDGTLESVDIAEKRIVRFCQRVGYSERQRCEIGLAVRESVANAILHGNCCDPKKKVMLAAELRDAGVVISVKDEGKGFDPRSLPNPLDPRNLLRESGRGVYLVKALMDKVTIRRLASCGMQVTMVKYLSKPKTALRRSTK